MRFLLELQRLFAAFCESCASPSIVPSVKAEDQHRIAAVGKKCRACWETKELGGMFVKNSELRLRSGQARDSKRSLEIPNSHWCSMRKRTILNKGNVWTCLVGCRKKIKCNFKGFANLWAELYLTAFPSRIYLHFLGLIFSIRPTRRTVYTLICSYIADSEAACIYLYPLQRPFHRITREHIHDALKQL